MAEKNNANIGFEKQIWDAACVLWGHIPDIEYRKVIVGLIFLRYISSSFEKRYNFFPLIACCRAYSLISDGCELYVRSWNKAENESNEDELQ